MRWPDDCVVAEWVLDPACGWFPSHPIPVSPYKSDRVYAQLQPDCNISAEERCNSFVETGRGDALQPLDNLDAEFDEGPNFGRRMVA